MAGAILEYSHLDNERPSFENVAYGFDRPARRFRFHVLGLVHLPVSRTYMACAFTQKIEKLCRMLMSMGHEVFLYGAEGSDAPCTEFFQTHTLRDLRDTWGDGDNRFDTGYNWHRQEFRHDFNQHPRSDVWHKYNAVARHHIESHKREDDFLLIMQGVYQQPVDEAVGLWLTCEPGIGYRGSYTRFKAFESAYLMNFKYGSNAPNESINGNYYDRVIPNYFEPEDFPFNEGPRDDYIFYIGRMIQRKGVQTAINTAQALGKRILLAGQGTFPTDYKKAEFVGHVGPERRAELMGNASCVMVPTQYLEAFGGVNVEAQLTGTPVLTTNFGVFPETVVHGVTGFRCDTMNDFVRAAERVGDLDPHRIRAHAERYLTTNVRWEFEKWWHDLYQLYLSAHVPGAKGWSHIERVNNGLNSGGDVYPFERDTGDGVDVDGHQPVPDATG